VARQSKVLSAFSVARLNTPGLHFVGEVPGLALQVLPTGARTWILRIMIAGKRRDMGLGGFPAVTLAQARDAARKARAKVKEGIDPIEEARANRSALLATAAASLSFEDCADRYINAQKAAWKNAKSEQQWRNTLATYAYPVMGKLLVRDIGTAHVHEVLEPIWTTKTETASRLRGRIESVLDWATVRGYRTGLNPARWKGHLDKTLPAAGKVAKKEHHRALDISELGTFMEKLRKMDGTGARALEFAILTAARSGEVRGATWDEIDFNEKVWTVPASRMKAKKEHRVPLSSAAIQLLKSLPQVAGVPYIFPAQRKGKNGGMVSDMTLVQVVRRIGVDAVPHGFRSTFRDWVAERTNYPNEVAEMALAHTIESKVEAAYRRGTLFAKRALMMEDWAVFCSRIETEGEVVHLFKSA